MRGDTRLTFSVVILYVVETVPAFSSDAAPIVLGTPAIASLHALASSKLGHRDVAAAAAPAARPNVLLEDPRLLFPVVICVNRPSQTLPGARVDFEGKDAAGSTVDVERAVSPVAADTSFVVLATAACERSRVR